MSVKGITQSYDKNVLRENRSKLYRNLVSHSINDNLGKPLTSATEEGWETAFQTILFLNYHSPFTDSKLEEALQYFPNASAEMQKSFLTNLYAFKKISFTKTIAELLPTIKDDYVFAMAESFISLTDTGHIYADLLKKSLEQKKPETSDGKRLDLLAVDLFSPDLALPDISSLFDNQYLPGTVLVLSFQRKERNYPGLVLVRDTSGNFIKDNGSYLVIPQLARSLSNMPYYFFNGNTPQGIYRMMGFDTSKASFIGRTTNLQLKMPYETKPSLFYNDTMLKDSVWDAKNYLALLPANFRNYYPIFQTTAAGKIGRTEIIAHGTTVDPDYYKSNPYYPLTPTQGCLTTKEIWDSESGKLIESDQLAFTQLINKAGGPHGYLIVLELDDKKSPVTLIEIEERLKNK